MDDIFLVDDSRVENTIKNKKLRYSLLLVYKNKMSPFLTPSL